jgi:hypothetical protein
MGQVALPDEDTMAELYIRGVEFLESAGLSRKTMPSNVNPGWLIFLQQAVSSTVLRIRNDTALDLYNNV